MLWIITHYPLNSIFRSLLWTAWLMYGFYFCCELEQELEPRVFPSILFGVHDLGHTYSLVSLQWSGISNQRMLLLTENCLQCQKWSPYKGRAPFSVPICAKKERSSPANVDQGLLQSDNQLSSAVTRGLHPPPPSIPPFLLAQNISVSHSIIMTPSLEWPSLSLTRVLTVQLQNCQSRLVQTQRQSPLLLLLRQ